VLSFLLLADGVVEVVDHTTQVVVRAVGGDQIVIVYAVDHGLVFTVSGDVKTITATGTIVLAALLLRALAPTARIGCTSILGRTRNVQAHLVGQSAIGC